MTTCKPRALVLLDRDGCLIEEKDYLHDPDQIVLVPGAVEAIRLLKNEGLACVICTNQAGVARGKFSEDDVERVHARLTELIVTEGTSVDGIYYSTSHPDAEDPRHRTGLHRRKPEPGMATEAIEDLGLQGIPVFAVGDKVSDVEFGRNAGGEGVLVRTGYGLDSERRLTGMLTAAPVADDVLDAAHMILNDLIKAAWPDDSVLAKKLRTPAQLRRVAEEHRRAGRKSVFANGCFDLLHGGHISFLENSRAAGDLLFLGVNSNSSVARLKGDKRPLVEEPARMQVLAGFECVDYLTIFYTDSADVVIEAIHPDIHSKGTDYRSDNVPELQTTRRLGIETVIAGAAKENSTRDIIEIVVERSRSGAL